VTDQEQNKLGEVLRTAREAKGVDLARVERDTKIRARYLAALETGDYGELPGAVYTKGFLRNYGAYLGLDIEYLVDLYRLESAQPTTERPSMPVPPRPISTRRRRPLVVTPGVILGALLTAGVAVFIIYLVGEFVTFARTPGLTITDPAGDVAGYQQMEYRIVGDTEPDSRVRVDGLRENPSVTADSHGHFEILVALVPGSNVITLVATDPLTNRDSQAVSRTIIVGNGPSASPGGGVTFTAPKDGATVRGTVRVTGTALAGTKVTVSARLVAPAEPTIRIESLAGGNIRVPRPRPRAPEPQTITADTSGDISASLALAPGEWEIRLAAGDGGTPLSRRVSVEPGSGLQGVLRVSGGTSYVEVDEDGQPKRNISGRNADAGTRVELSARDELRVRVGNAGVVHLVINGVDLGAMGKPGTVVEWRITRR
jgi:cytoskeletal protein RodZ